MIWRKLSNFVIAVVLTIALAVVSWMNVIGPMHMNAVGGMSEPSITPFSSLIYLVFSWAVIWIAYLSLRKKPEALFFTLIILGIALILGGAFLWRIIGG